VCDDVHCATVCQVVDATVTGATAKDFKRKVQKASAGHPWYTDEPPLVNICAFKYNSFIFNS